MKILFIDPICPEGHKNFNRIHINALKNQYGEVDCVFEDGYLADEFKTIYSFPEIFMPNNGLTNRIKIYRNWRAIAKHVDFSKYDAVIVSYYDEITFGFLKLPKNCYLINHNNLSGVESSSLKRLLYKSISKGCTQIVMDKLSHEYLESIGIPKIKTIAHGLPAPFAINEDWDSSYQADIKDFSHIIFSPSAGSTDVEFIYSLTSNQDFIELLKSTDTKLIIKVSADSSIPHISSPYFQFIKERLSTDDYRQLFLRSSIILIPYPETFKYRSSGVFMESIANHKNFLVSAIPAFTIYENLFGQSHFFDSISDLINKAKVLLSEKESEILTLQAFDKLLTPDYSFIEHTSEK